MEWYFFLSSVCPFVVVVVVVVYEYNTTRHDMTDSHCIFTPYMCVCVCDDDELMNVDSFVQFFFGFKIFGSPNFFFRYSRFVYSLVGWLVPYQRVFVCVMVMVLKIANKNRIIYPQMNHESNIEFIM